MHQLRLLIEDKFTRTSAAHIENGDLENYLTDGTYIYKNLTDKQYNEAITNGDNEPWKMEELGLECEYNFGTIYKG